ncbi:MAG TPA: type II toxin-antitoxin system VapC family toxin, partial [Planctomycetaceae bacterium]|nr:type II toxin-antitoxin system VapC family toxin [Planctomycetaceae bacterium]
LDTNICSAYIRGERKVEIRALRYGQLSVSAITVGELLTWAYRGRSGPRWQAVIREAVASWTILDVTAEVAEAYGRLQAFSLDIGQRRPGFDLLIAATALVHDLTLVTHNTRDFAGIPDLRLDDWQSE